MKVPKTRKAGPKTSAARANRPEIERLRRELREARRTEKVLLECEAKYRALSENSTDSIYVIAKDRTVLSVNMCAAGLLGKRPDEIVGRSIFELFPRELAEQYSASLEKVLGDGVSTRKESGLVAGGREYWIDVTLSPLRDENGAVTAVIGVSRDTTEQKRDDEFRRISFDFLHLTQSAPNARGLIAEAIGFFKNRLGFEAAGIRERGGEDFPYFETSGFSDPLIEAERSLSARDTTGKTAKHGMGHPTLEYMCGNVLSGRTDPTLPFFTPYGSFWTNSSTEFLASATNADRQARTRNSRRGKDFESVALIPLKAGGGISGLLEMNDKRRDLLSAWRIALLEDLASRLAAALSERRAEDATRASEERFRTLAAMAPVGIYLTDEGGRCLYVNRQWAAMAGVDPEAALGDGWISGVHPEDRDKITSNWEKMVASRGRWGLTYRFRTPAGKTTWVYGVASALPGEGGSVSGYIGVNLDISGRLETEQRLRDFSRQILAAREDEKRRISVALHHDIGSLSIGVDAQFDAAEDDLQQGHCAAAAAPHTAGRALFEDAMARLKALAAELRPPDLDVLGLAPALREHISRQARLKSQRITFTDATRGMKIPGPVATALFRTAQEAVTNALRHSGARSIRVRLAAARGGVHLAVRDDGRGFDPARVATSRKNRLGLAFMEEMVASLGGRFEIRAADGRGTGVIAFFPKETVAP